MMMLEEDNLDSFLQQVEMIILIFVFVEK